MVRIESAVRHYKREHLPNLKRLLEWYSSMASLSDAIINAAMGKDERGKRHPHQRRLREMNLVTPRRRLLGLKEQMRQCTSFEELLDLVEAITDRIHGLGELYAYDTALRIGAYLGLLPEKVYLHAGTRVGAQALGFDTKARSIQLQSLPQPFHSLEPHEAEDVLCIYKDQFKRKSV